ncbi:hypothetical protein TA3x_004396 [Tundrisphaera sp. TA3]|uniref:hypothetical protein n=1 Tax=Tundrisphaera sp. TA3 TaxID=3435775 RepID=UPI003EBB74B1
MECTLHRQLKGRYGPDIGGRVEVAVSGYRIDAVTPDGLLIEVQTGALGPLRPKLERLLPTSRVRVIKPVVVRRRLIWRDRSGATGPPGRRSPWRGTLLDAFDDLIGLVRIFPHANLEVDLLAVDIDEIRVARRKRPGFAVVDRSLREVRATARLREARDLWDLLPDGVAASPFTTRDLSDRLDRPIAFAQRVAYCLLHAGAARVSHKIGSHRVYEAAAG